MNILAKIKLFKKDPAPYNVQGCRFWFLALTTNLVFTLKNMYASVMKLVFFFYQFYSRYNYRNLKNLKRLKNKKKMFSPKYRHKQLM